MQHETFNYTEMSNLDFALLYGFPSCVEELGTNLNYAPRSVEEGSQALSVQNFADSVMSSSSDLSPEPSSLPDHFMNQYANSMRYYLSQNPAYTTSSRADINTLAAQKGSFEQNINYDYSNGPQWETLGSKVQYPSQQSPNMFGSTPDFQHEIPHKTYVGPIVIDRNVQSFQGYGANLYLKPHTINQNQVHAESPQVFNNVPFPPTNSEMDLGYNRPKNVSTRSPINVNKKLTSSVKNYRLVRGVSTSGSTTRPPKNKNDSSLVYVPVEIEFQGESIPGVCYSPWSKAEDEDWRRIIRIERIQRGPKLIIKFSSLGAASENPTTLPGAPDADIIEVSCLKCDVNPLEIDDKDDDKKFVHLDNNGKYHQYYITSVEVIEIVELLIGAECLNSSDKRRERGRIRSNLVPFWSKRPISSRKEQSSLGSASTVMTNKDFKVELAKRMMSYEIRKPRGFDREVRILSWERLIPSLRRALQSYYVEIPANTVLNDEGY